MNLYKTLLLSLFMALHSVGYAKEITLKYKNLTLNAELELAEGKSIKDGIILITHGSLAHRDMQTLKYLRELLAEYEYNTLAINLSLGIDNRHGMYDCAQAHRHLFDDAVAEIDQWVRWLTSQGAKQITLLGHSKGGAQTALYGVENDNKAIHALILMAPATKTKGGSKKVLSNIQRAKIIRSFGGAKELISGVPIMHCQKTRASVESFLSYNTFTLRQDTPSLLPELKKPTLVLIGGKDQVVVDLPKRLTALKASKIVQTQILPGSGHFFRSLNMDEAVERIDAFLQAISKSHKN